MSAFNVDDRHIDAITTYAATERDLGRYRFEGMFYDMRDPLRIGTILRRANNESMIARYGADEGAEPFYKHRPFMKRLTHADVYLACSCLDYQSCEYDGWETSEAKAILDAIQAHAGYSMARAQSDTWEITDRWSSGKRAA